MNQKADSITAAAAMLGVPASKLKRAKRLGCPAFQGGRVDLDKLKAWLLERGAKTPTAKPKTPPVPVAIGAGAALARLEKAEAASYTELQTALAGGDPDEVDRLRKGWLAISEMLRKTDLAVEESRRESGELLPRSVIEKAIGRFAEGLLISLEGQIQQLAYKLAGVKTWQEAMHVLQDLPAHGVMMACASVVLIEQQGCPVPPWLVTAFEQGTKQAAWGRDPDPEVRRLAEGIQEFSKFMMNPPAET